MKCFRFEFRHLCFVKAGMIGVPPFRRPLQRERDGDIPMSDSIRVPSFPILNVAPRPTGTDEKDLFVGTTSIPGVLAAPPRRRRTRPRRIHDVKGNHAQTPFR